jgi:predicted TPR repeat methyltransferase
VPVLANSTDYRERLYAGYATTRSHDIKWASVRRDFAVYDLVAGPFLPADLEAKMLDLGCGFGSFVAYLRQRGYRRAHGIDISLEMVEAASRLGIEGVQRADLRCFLARSGSEYALISALDVIEHFHKDEILGLLDKVYCALADGGRMLICTPNAMSKYGRWCRYADFTHEHIFDANSIRQCLTAAGFRNVAVMPLGPVIRGPASALRWALWQLWEPFLKLSVAVESGWERGQVFTPNLVAVAQK